ncbi:MAG: Fe2+-dependent dioxygenase [Caulobacteraceae bacterium]
MFLEIPDLLSPQELERLQHVARTATFIDGRITNPHSKVKDNLQLDYGDPIYQETSRLMAAALQRHEDFRNAIFPKIMAPPMLTRYPPGKAYGPHSDAPFLPIGARPIRTDLSCTIFISPPEAYEGGELCAALGTQRVCIKGPAGSAVVYPSDTLHEVTAVTAGERVVGLTFIESRIADRARRELLYDLNEVAALEGLGMSWENYTRIQHVQSRLLRMWADPG